MGRYKKGLTVLHPINASEDAGRIHATNVLLISFIFDTLKKTLKIVSYYKESVYLISILLHKYVFIQKIVACPD